MPDLPADVSERGRRNMERFQRIVRNNAQLRALWDRIPRKRVIAECIICKNDDMVGISAFEPYDPTSMPFLEGRVVFYGVCVQHTEPDRQLVEDRIHELHGVT